MKDTPPPPVSEEDPCTVEFTENKEEAETYQATPIRGQVLIHITRYLYSLFCSIAWPSN